MPYVWIPSSNLGSNRPSSSYAHQTHGTLGVLAKGTDPRNRGRRRSRSEIEAASRAERAAREEHLEKMRKHAAARAAAETEKKDARRNAALQRQAEASKRAIALNPEAARLEAARQQTRDEELARKADWASRGGKAERLSPQQQAAAMEQRRRTEAANQIRYGREATAATPVSAQFLMGPERVSSVLSGAPIRDILDQPIVTPHTARAASNLFKYDPSAISQPKSQGQTAQVPEAQADLSRVSSQMVQPISETQPPPALKQSLPIRPSRSGSQKFSPEESQAYLSRLYAPREGPSVELSGEGPSLPGAPTPPRTPTGIDPRAAEVERKQRKYYESQAVLPGASDFFGSPAWREIYDLVAPPWWSR